MGRGPTNNTKTMNNKPQTINPYHTNTPPPNWQATLTTLAQNFIGRKSIFSEINQFIQQRDRGYISIIAPPGSGKSALLAKYVLTHGHTVYYNCQIDPQASTRQTQVDLFLQNISHQLIHRYNLNYPTLPENATQDGGFLILLLEQISSSLPPKQPLIIAIDALDALNKNDQISYTNILYLPRYVPQQIYFLITRRPFLSQNSRLLIEAPHKVINLKNYDRETRADMSEYIQQFCSQNQHRQILNNWLAKQQITQATLTENLLNYAGNCWQYLTTVLKAIIEGFYQTNFDQAQLPPALISYYQQHWQKMFAQPPTELELNILQQLANTNLGLSVETIAENLDCNLDADEFDIEEILEQWWEFLQVEKNESERKYSFYHPSFREFIRNNC